LNHVSRATTLVAMPDKLYLEHSHGRAFDAEVIASADGWRALSRTAFYPGGGGQPADRGRLTVGGEALAVDCRAQTLMVLGRRRHLRDWDPGLHVLAGDLPLGCARVARARGMGARIAVTAHARVRPAPRTVTAAAGGSPGRSLSSGAWNSRAW